MTLKEHTRRTHRRNGRDELTAVAPIRLSSESDRLYLDQVLRESRRKGKQAWKHYDDLGEVHYSIRRTARVAGYTKFVVKRTGADGKAKEPDSRAVDIVEGIYSRDGGLRGLVEQYYTLLKVPADMILVRTRDEDNDHDGYAFLSADSIDQVSTDGSSTERGLRWLRMPNVGPGSSMAEVRSTRIPPEDVLGRIWQPSARFADVPDSALAALEVECDTLKTLTLTVKAKLRSRFALAGILFLPNTISQARIAGLNPKTGMSSSVMDDVIAALTRNVTNWEDASTWLPILLMGEEDAGGKIEHITLDREVFETDIRLRAELIERILFGLDIIGGAAKGGEESSHWGAWEASDQERRIAVAPDLDTLTWALERVVLRAQMQDAGIDDATILEHELEWDLSDAAVRTNQQEDVRQAYDRGAAGAAAVRRASGISEEDAMTEAEQIIHAGTKVQNPILMSYGYQGKKWADVDWKKVNEYGQAPPGPAPASTGTKAKAGPGVGNPGAPGGGDRDGPKRSRPAD
jgi:hypothetical protein